MLLIVLDRACWEKNLNVADESILVQVLNNGGYDGPELLRRASQTDAKRQLRQLTAQAREYGLCGVPSYRILAQSGTTEWDCISDVIWGQDELNVVEDLIAGWSTGDTETLAKPRVATSASQKEFFRL